MARRIREVNRSWLEACIREAEKDGPVKGGIVALYKVVTDLYNVNDQIPEQVTYSVIGLRIKEWDLPFITKAGKRGRTKGSSSANPNLGHHTRVPKAEKFAANAEVQAHFSYLVKVTPERFLPILERVKEGSRTAAVKLHCLECSGYVTSEVRDCQCVSSCSLWAFRPYQGSVEVEEQTESE